MAMRQKSKKSQGYSLVEMMIATAVGVIVLGGAVELMRSATDVNDTVGQQTEMQQNARVAANSIATDLSRAGTNFPKEGVALPGGNGSKDSLRACDEGGCHIQDSVYHDGRLYPVTPGDGLGAMINGVQTDVVTMAFKEPEQVLDDYGLVGNTPSGSQVDVDSRTSPPITTPGRGVEVGDLIVIENNEGAALGVATTVTANRIVFANNDPLDVNQPSADHGNIASLAVGNGNGNLLPASAYKISVVTYFINADDPNNPRLMRQVNAHPPVPVAEHIVDLQVDYDIFDSEALAGTARLPEAGGTPGLIRKVNISVTARSPGREMYRQDFRYLTLTTAVSIRNLSFGPKYP